MEYTELESEQRQRNEELEHNQKMNILVMEEEYKIFTLLKPNLYIDKTTNQWICRYGDNISNDIFGCGKSPHDAILDFNKKWYENLK